MVVSDLGGMGWRLWFISVARRWMTRINLNKDTKYHSLAHNRSRTNRDMAHIDGNHMDHTQINQECRGCIGGRLG